MKEVKAIIRPERLSDVLQALHDIPRLPGVTVSHVRGFGRRLPADPEGESFAATDMTKLEIVVPEDLLDEVVGTIERAAHTVRFGDGKIFTASAGRLAERALAQQVRASQPLELAHPPKRVSGEAVDRIRQNPSGQLRKRSSAVMRAERD